MAGWPRCTSLGIATLALVIASAPAQEGDVAVFRERALAALPAVARGDLTAIAQIRADFEIVLAARPDDGFARVHYGWLLLMQAWSVPLADAKALALEGCAQMDAAVAAVPGDPVIRLARARSDYQVPLVLGREPVAEQDFTWLVAGARNEAHSWPDTLRREILFHAGAFALKQRRPLDAIKLLESAATISADTPSETDMQSMLALARREAGAYPGHAENPHPAQSPASAP